VTRIKHWAVNLALIAFGIILALIIGETGLRLTGLAKPGFYVYDRDRGWGLRPGAAGWQDKEGQAYVRINREGFRGPEYTVTKPGNTLRIAVLGDSFAEGQQVPEADTFCAVLQRALGTCPALAGRHVQVLNFGVNGYGTAQELMTLRHQALQFSPDVVVLAIFTGNDIKNNSVALEQERCRPFFVFDNGELVLGGPFWDSHVMRMRCMARFESRLRFDLHDWQLLRVAARAWQTLRQRLPQGHKKAPPMGSEPGVNDAIYLPPRDPVWQEAWRATEGEIAMIDHETTAHGAKFLAVTLSNGIQVYPDPAVRRNYMRRFGLHDLFYPDQRIEALGARDGFPVLALAPPMQAYADAHHAYLHGFSNTAMGWGHWNSLGNHIAGELIAQRVCAMLGGQTHAAVSGAQR